MAGGTFWLQADVSDNGKGRGSLLFHCPHGPGTDAQPLHPRHMTSHLPGASQGWASSCCKVARQGSSEDLVLPPPPGFRLGHQTPSPGASHLLGANCAVRPFVCASVHHPAATQKAEGL